MHIYQSATDWVIAASMADANAVLCEHYEMSAEQLTDQAMHVTRELPDDHVLPVVDEDGVRHALPAATWVARAGRGFLASTEY